MCSLTKQVQSSTMTCSKTTSSKEIILINCTKELLKGSTLKDTVKYTPNTTKVLL